MSAFFQKKSGRKKTTGAGLGGVPCGGLSARPVWCFRPPPVGRPGRSHRPQGGCVVPVLEGGWDSHFLAFSLGLARSHLGSGRGEDRLGLASVLVTCWLLSFHCPLLIEKGRFVQDRKKRPFWAAAQVRRKFGAQRRIAQGGLCPTEHVKSPWGGGGQRPPEPKKRGLLPAVLFFWSE